MRPVEARPAAIETMFCSATPTLKNRSGWRAAKSIVRLAWARSAVRTTIRGSRSPSSASSSPATKAGIVRASMPRPVAASFTAAAAPPRKVSLIAWPPPPSRVVSAIAASGEERLEAALDLGDHVVVVLTLEVAHVPLRVALHPAHAPALDRVGDDQLGRGDGVGVKDVEDVEDGVEVVAVDPVNPPAEALKPRPEGLEAHDVLGVAVDREVVAVDDRDQRAELELARGHGRLPHLPLVKLAVAGQAVGAERAAVDPGAERHPHRHRQPVPERAGAEVDPGDLAHVRVVAERAVQAGVVVEQLPIEEPNVGEHGVEADRGVALAEHEPVAVRPVRLLGSVVQLGVVEGGEQLGGGEGAGVVAGAGDPCEPDRFEAHELGPDPEPLHEPRALGRSTRGVPQLAAHARLSRATPLPCVRARIYIKRLIINPGARAAAALDLYF